MVTTKPRIVIIGAGMAGLTAANKLYTSSNDLFDLYVVEGGNRIGGRINTSEFCGDKIEMGATWIHGIKGSPIQKIAQEINSLESTQPWEFMDGSFGEPIIIAEGGYELNPSLVKSVSNFFDKLMSFAQGKPINEDLNKEETKSSEIRNGGSEKLSIGAFLKNGLDAYWGSMEGKNGVKEYGDWTQKSILEAIFEMKENTQRIYTSVDDLLMLDFEAESEYRMFEGEEITIAKGYMSIIESIASVLPYGTIQLGKKVIRIEWQPENHGFLEGQNGDEIRPVKLHFSDGSIMFADHVIVTVSLGVLKAGMPEKNSGMFDPPLPPFKTEAISRLGYGVVNKLFLELVPSHEGENGNINKFPFLQMAFHRPGSGFRHPKIPWWMRRTNSLCPIYGNSSVVLSWFAGKEALELESLNDEEIISGVSRTFSCFLPKSNQEKVNPNSLEGFDGNEFTFSKILRTTWGSDPLFLGSYSYVEVGSSGDDLDTMAVPLPEKGKSGSNSSHPLQIMFAGEATHRTHYSTTHGAYFSGLREAKRLLQHYGVQELVLHH